MKKKVIIANWKMNHDFYETTSYLRNLLKIIYENKIHHKKKIIIAPSFPFLHISNQILQGTTLSIAAQNIHQMENGSYTGEVSASMLRSIGIKKVILGHSERRKYFTETNDILIKKIKISLKYGFHIIFCIGETGIDRKKEEHFFTVKKQLEKTIFHFSLEKINSFIIAYEPIWAIGTGNTASPEVVQLMHQYIRSLFLNKYGETVSNDLSILYGGSINDMNARDLFLQKDIDGGLVGNSSLQMKNFLKIIQS
ncbi:triose-phosphate isomerase [Blattabacterium sp. (Cryptocercus kyebangensis)]|uniref:triose-phosphate isomerase n=1 Tax=Blattabacterium sp. (Cryptocercus kyebangensis) TaxID=298656 RepID=UPI000D7C5ED1|nr:triose-phosphate isomerase [Blattabacterium sp. (Cryptocercus kyebangensis)]AWU43566.1 triose-phosphate isomerase [Blattabacterium sp. (Cryptocercus kyebangensis)]